MISTGRFTEANELCKKHPCFLGDMLQAGLSETEMGYQQIEKALEDAAAEHSARMMRKVEYLNVIGTIAPMLGLLGTVWGMIQAFLKFESQVSPSVAEFRAGHFARVDHHPDGPERGDSRAGGICDSAKPRG
ncbi:MAG: MotA/TolQ/ExbB proton channel family protein [Planctomycetaceae bacterium]